MTSPAVIDLDAAKREARYPDGVTVRLGGVDFTLPGELPADVFDPLLSDEVDLVGVVKQVLADKDSDLSSDVLEVLLNRPNLPRTVIAAVKDCFRLLFGDDQYDVFLTQRPSFPDYIRLAKALPPIYGVSLGEAFGSPASSESDGATAKQTSGSTAESTAATSGETPETPATSDSGESATT